MTFTLTFDLCKLNRLLCAAIDSHESICNIDSCESIAAHRTRFNLQLLRQDTHLRSITMVIQRL